MPNIEFSRFSYAKYWIFKIWTICQILNVQDLGYVIYWIVNCNFVFLAFLFRFLSCHVHLNTLWNLHIINVIIIIITIIIKIWTMSNIKLCTVPHINLSLQIFLSLHTSPIHFLINIAGWKRSSLASEGRDSKEFPSASLSANIAFSFSVWIKFSRNSLGSDEMFFPVSLIRYVHSSSSSSCSLCKTWSAMLKIFSLVGKQVFISRWREIASLWVKLDPPGKRSAPCKYR